MSQLNGGANANYFIFKRLYPSLLESRALNDSFEQNSYFWGHFWLLKLIWFSFKLFSCSIFPLSTGTLTPGEEEVEEGLV